MTIGIVVDDPELDFVNGARALHILSLVASARFLIRIVLAANVNLRIISFVWYYLL